MKQTATTVSLIVFSVLPSHARWIIPTQQTIGARDMASGYQMPEEWKVPQVWSYAPVSPYNKCNEKLTLTLLKETISAPLFSEADGVPWDNLNEFAYSSTTGVTSNMQFTVSVPDGKRVHSVIMQHRESPMGHFKNYDVYDGRGAKLTGHAAVGGAPQCEVGKKCIVWQEGEFAALTKFLTIKLADNGAYKANPDGTTDRTNPQFQGFEVHGCDRDKIDPVPDGFKTALELTDNTGGYTDVINATCGSQKARHQNAECCANPYKSGTVKNFPTMKDHSCDTPVTMYCIHRLTPFGVEAGFDTVLGPHEGLFTGDGNVDYTSIDSRFRVPDKFIENTVGNGILGMEEYSVDPVRNIGVLRLTAPNSAAYAKMMDGLVSQPINALSGTYPWTMSDDPTKPYYVDLEIYVHGMCNKAWKATSLPGYEAAAIGGFASGNGIYPGLSGSATRMIPFVGSYQASSLL